MPFTAGPALIVVKRRLVITATGIAANIMKGFLFPKRDTVLSESDPMIGPTKASQTDPTALMVPASAGCTPATVVR